MLIVCTRTTNRPGGAHAPACVDIFSTISVEFRGHDFGRDDVVELGGLARFPDAASRESRVGRQAAKTTDQLLPNAAENDALEFASAVVARRQQYLNELFMGRRLLMRLKPQSQRAGRSRVNWRLGQRLRPRTMPQAPEAVPQDTAVPRTEA